MSASTVGRSHVRLAQVVVKFWDNVALLDPHNLEQSILQQSLGAWDELKRDFPGITIEAAFSKVWDRLDHQIQIAKARTPGYAPPDFKAFCIIRITPQTDANMLVSKLRTWPSVEYAYATYPPALPAVNAGPNPLEVYEAYQQIAPVGINAQYAWNIPGGDGAAQVFGDIEYGYMQAHEDLTTQNITVPPGANPLESNGSNPNYNNDTGHGTAVLGVIYAADNLVGGVGIVPNAQQAYFFPMTLNGMRTFSPATVNEALDYLQAGNILLIEAQMVDPSGSGNFGPVEMDPLWLAVIRLATSLGIVVIEPAGNGGINLDLWLDPNGKNRLNRISLDFVDSGAIIVGSATSTVQPVPLLPENNPATGNQTGFGNRVDCFAWGDNIYTCALYTPPSPPAYRSDFNGTSGASAIIAGAAIATQGMAQAATGSLLSPGNLRALFSLELFATPSANGRAVDGIGCMPDLQKIAGYLSAAPDIYLRHYIGDTGVIDPSYGGELFASPDIVLASSIPQNADPQTLYGETSGNENTLSSDVIVSGQDNYIFLRARNRGAADATNVQGILFYSPPATLVQPQLWTQIGDILGGTGIDVVTFPDIPSGDLLTVADVPFVWQADKIPSPGHYCYVAAIGSALEPLPSIDALDFLNDLDYFVEFIKTNTTVAWRNFQVIDFGAEALALISLDFLVPGQIKGAINITLEVNVRLPGNSLVFLDGPPDLLTVRTGASGVLLDALNRGSDLATPTKAGNVRLTVPRYRPFLLENVYVHREARHEMTLHLEVPRESPHMAGTLFVRQLYKGTEVGRITWRLVPRRTRSVSR